MLAARPRRAAAAALAALSLARGVLAGHVDSVGHGRRAATTLLAPSGRRHDRDRAYTRTADAHGRAARARAPDHAIARYSVDLGRPMPPTRADYSAAPGRRRGDPGGMQSLSVRFARTPSYLVGHRTAGDTTAPLAARARCCHIVNDSYGLYELALARCSRRAATAGQFALVPLTPGRAPTTPLRGKRHRPRLGAHRLRFGNPLIRAARRTGRHPGVDGSSDHDQGARRSHRRRRTSTAMARNVGDGERGEPPAGQASTRDTVRATVGAAQRVDRLRPARAARAQCVGRTACSATRSGAPVPTRRRSSAPTRISLIGGKTIPAGTYTLWTARPPDRLRLVVNKQAGQWGTELRHRTRTSCASRCSESAVATPVERFTIALEPQGSDGLLTSPGARSGSASLVRSGPRK